MGRFLLIGAAALAVLALAYAGVTMLMTPEAKSEPAPAARAEPEPEPPAAKPSEPEMPADAPAARRPRPRKESLPAPEPAAPPPAGPTLVVESDVPGASVFVDRKFVGTTPLRTTDVPGGSHQLNASATGEDGLAQAIEIAETGETTIALRFREVRLNASVAVVHKHGMGRSCEGRLVATPEGIRYDTANRSDAFAFPFSALEVFEIDYLKKELKVKQKGGKTWNFTDKSDNADKLFVFHRDVTKAREKLAALGR
ncbi:MAG: PEGA domain-containing protein [Vicinamibacterales bacterium]